VPFAGVAGAPNMLNKSYMITAEVEIPQGGAEGMLVMSVPLHRQDRQAEGEPRAGGADTRGTGNDLRTLRAKQ
jgi:hypothetical protein